MEYLDDNKKELFRIYLGMAGSIITLSRYDEDFKLYYGKAQELINCDVSGLPKDYKFINFSPFP